MASMRRISVSLFWLPLFASFSVPSPLPVDSVTQYPAPDQTVRGRVLCIWRRAAYRKYQAAAVTAGATVGVTVGEVSPSQ